MLNIWGVSEAVEKVEEIEEESIFVFMEESLAEAADEDEEEDLFPDPELFAPCFNIFFCLSNSSKIFLCWSILPDDGLLKARELSGEDVVFGVEDEEAMTGGRKIKNN